MRNDPTSELVAGSSAVAAGRSDIPDLGSQDPGQLLCRGQRAYSEIRDNTTLSTTQSDEILEVNGPAVTIDNPTSTVTCRIRGPLGPSSGTVSGSLARSAT